MLSAYGFKQVYDLSGGIRAWDGLVAEGPPDLNLFLISGEESVGQIVTLAYGMEDGLGQFYRLVENRTTDSELSRLAGTLASVEERHKEFLVSPGQEHALQELSARDAGHIEDSEPVAVMEGGFTAGEFIEGHPELLANSSLLLDLAMMLETQALDLYLRFAGKTRDAEARTVLFRIADEEKAHLAALGRLRGEKK
jgi:sulfur-carrier protein adenylyltransferase/sulfurtransferase